MKRTSQWSGIILILLVSIGYTWATWRYFTDRRFENKIATYQFQPESIDTLSLAARDLNNPNISTDSDIIQ